MVNIRILNGKHVMRLAADQLSALIDAIEADARRLGSVRAWAVRHGLAPAYVANVLSGRRPPSDRIIAAVGLRLELVPARRAG